MRFAGKEISLGSLLHRRGPNPQVQTRLEKIAALKGTAGATPVDVSPLPPEAPTVADSAPVADPAGDINRQIESIQGQIADGNERTRRQDADRIAELKGTLAKLQGDAGEKAA